MRELVLQACWSDTYEIREFLEELRKDSTPDERALIDHASIQLLSVSRTLNDLREMRKR